MSGNFLWELNGTVAKIMFFTQMELWDPEKIESRWDNMKRVRHESLEGCTKAYQSERNIEVWTILEDIQDVGVADYLKRTKVIRKINTCTG